MGSTITRRSSDHAIPAGEALLDASGQPAPVAPLLLSWRPQPWPVSHGRAPSISASPGAAEPGSSASSADRAQATAPRGLADLGPASVLRATGSEREGWMQGVQTADVRAIPAEGAAHTLFLNARGRAVCDGLLWRMPGALLAAVPPERLEILRAHLDALLIMEDAELSIATGLRALRLSPDGAPDLLAALSPEQRDLFSEVRGLPGPLGFELLLPDDLAQALLAAISERPDPAALERERIALGVPAWGRDFDDASTPLEAGLDAAISFGKGCYVGQEVIAMATYRGRVPWNLVRLEVPGAAPAAGSPLDTERGGKGRVTSSAEAGERALLLGLVHREKIEPGSAVLLGDGRTATVLGLPFGSRPGAGTRG